MARLILSMVIIITFSILNSKAQTLSIGPVLGANYSTISELTNAKSRIGLSAGAFANYSIDEHYGLNVKLIFSQLGSKIENSTLSNRLNYFQIPLSGVYFFGVAGNSFRPKIFAGPYVGFLLNSKDNNGNDIVIPNGNDYYNKVDFGGQIGAGFNYRIMSRTWLNVDASYASSFGKISDVTNISYKNTNLSFNAGISFPINGTN
jgi:Outer membrane protein beta-barrel domain